MTTNLDRIIALRETMDLDPDVRLAREWRIEQTLPPGWRIAWDHPTRVELYHVDDLSLIGWYPEINSMGHLLEQRNKKSPFDYTPEDFKSKDAAWARMERVREWLWS